MVCSTTRWAPASAASTAARSPNALSSARLSGACGQIAGAPGSSASSTSVTARQSLIFDHDRFGTVAGRRQAFSDHDGDRFADKAHPLDRERQLRLVENLAVGRRRKRRHLDVVRIGRIGEMRHADEAIVDIVAAGQHRDHARQLAGGRYVDRAKHARAHAGRARTPHRPAPAATRRRYSGPAPEPAAGPRSGASAGRRTARALAPLNRDGWWSFPSPDAG